jgi:RNA polymerase sigma-70 factor (ECF subfamily)
MSGTKEQKGEINVIREWRNRLERGDDTWLDELYKENKDKFIIWASRKYDLNDEDLLDVYQSAVLSFYENVYYRRVEQLESAPGTYLFGIAKNLVLKRLRKEKMSERHEIRLQEHWRFLTLDKDNLEDTYQTVQKVLNTTAEPCKSIIEAFYLRGMSIQGIADQYNYKNADVVKTQKYRCMKSLINQVKSLLK